MDPQTSVLALLVVGFLSGLASDAARLPRVALQVLAGVALAPALHASVLHRCACDASAASPASAMRTFALLVALARGGLSVDFAALARVRIAVALAAILPYACELMAEALAARAWLPAETGLRAGDDESRPALVAYLAAALWSPASPSIVVPNMMEFVASGLGSAGSFALSAVPLEVGTAVVSFGVLEDSQKASVADGGNLADVLRYIPLQVFGSIAYGAFFACLFRLLHGARKSAPVARLLGGAAGPAVAAVAADGNAAALPASKPPMPPPPPHETLLLFLACYLASYVTCGDSLVPQVVGLFAALFAAVGVRLLCPELAPLLLAQLKVVWGFAECFLFTLTGAVIYSAIEAKSPAFSGAFIAVLVCGSLARLAACGVVAIAWQMQMHSDAAPRAVVLRALFLWAALTPKATVQASLGPLPGTELDVLDIEAETGDFIAESSAVAILWGALFGSLLTRTVGRRCAEAIELIDGGAVRGISGDGERVPLVEAAGKAELGCQSPGPSTYLGRWGVR